MNNRLLVLNAGGVIATADPEREYTSESINEPGLILEAIIPFIRAHEESRRRSSRGTVAAPQSGTARKKEPEPVDLAALRST